MSKLRYAVIFCGVLLGLNFSNIYADSTMAHIRNDSQGDWKFTASTKYGNFWVNQSLPNCVQENGPCTIPAGLHVVIQFTQTNGQSLGTLTITDRNGVHHDFDFRGGWGIPTGFTSGDGMGVMSFDNPYSGDIQINGDQWPSSSESSSKLKPK